MPALSRGQANTPSIINWFITVNGVLTDAYAVEYRIFDITAGLPGVQVFPTPAGTYEVVTAAPAKFSTGSYYAYDHLTALGYKPPLTEPVGTHRVEWRWKISGAAAWQADFEDFEVLVESSGSSVDTYISIQDVRDEGLSATTYPDAKVLSYIETWQAFLDRACRQWFLPKALVLQVDGTDSDAIHFGVPIISIDYVKLNGSPTALGTDLYKVYSEITYPDNRRNPRIKLIGDEMDDISIFSRPLGYGKLKFRKGRKNQEIKGVFGYVEADSSVPKLIKRALLKLVIEKLTVPLYGTSSAPVPALVGSILSETTDGPSREYGQAGGETKPRAAGLLGITNDPEILGIVKLFRAPIGVATPAHPSFT
jgi:hypothetical protein